MKTLYSTTFCISLCLLVHLSSCGTKEGSANPVLKSGEGYVEVEGGKIWYGIIGEGDKAPLVCLHGGPGGTSRRYFNLSEIAKERPVIMFDQLGSGQSDHHQDTSLLKVENFVEQVKAIKDALKLKEFYLLGASWGTALALEYYSAYPEGIEGLIFCSPYFSTALWTADADTLIMGLPDSTQAAIRKAEADSVFNTAAYAAANTLFASKHGRRKAVVAHPYDTVQADWSEFIYNYMWGPSEFTATGTLRDYDKLASLKKVMVPTLFTTGQFDEARVETVIGFQQMVPQAQFVMIPDAGHSTFNDNKPAVTAAIQSFLANQKP